MKKFLLQTLPAAIFLMLAGTAAAQFTISAEFRPRGEYRDGYTKIHDSTQDAVFNILGRSRLLFDYKNDRFIARFSLQHAFVFGENNYSSDTITRNTINMYEGWFQYNFLKNIGIKIGRMELTYDDQRLFGNSNWGPKGATHDVGVFKWEKSEKAYRGDLGFAINNAAPMGAFLASYPLKNYKYMAYLYEQKKFLKDQLTVALIGVTDIFQKPGVQVKKTTYDSLPVYDNTGNVIGYTRIPVVTTSTKVNPEMLYGRFTVGGNIGYTWKNLKVFAAGYYQGGHFIDGKKIGAGFLGGYVSYKVVKPLTLLVGYDWLSGNDYSDTTGLKTKYTSFSTLYGTAHGFYGYMDLWNSYVTSGATAGLTDLYAKATLSLGDKAYIEATWRMMGLAKGYLNKKEGSLPYTKVDKGLGNEIDVMCVYKPIKNLEINAAYCFFLASETMEKLNNLNVGTSEWEQYAYIMLTYKPTFFNSDNK
jgi:hypothetical protein